MRIRKPVRGAKGSSSAPSPTPSEDSDTLLSKAVATIVDVICEGEIEGLVADARSVFLNETVLQNADATYNYDVAFETRTGTQDQDVFTLVKGVESGTNIGVRLQYGTPYVYTVTDTDVGSIRVTLGIPQLSFENETTLNLGPSSISFFISRQADSGGYVSYKPILISGKTMSRYQMPFLVPKPDGVVSTWSVKVERTIVESASADLQNLSYIDVVTEIIPDQLRYPNSAAVAMRFDATQFSSVPNRAYDVKLLKIALPSNTTTLDDGSLSYTGSWDGTFRVGWSSNPAWCFYDLITNDRYGLGREIDPSIVDKWTLYEIGKYCDVQVDDGKGASEPRFSCNIYIQSREDAFKVLLDMASTFRGMVYWAGGTISMSQDAPSDPVYLYTTANIIDGAFTYVGASLKARHSVALISWNDPEDFYRLKVEYVEDSAAIAAFGYIETEVTAVGCTSRGQANRVGRWILYTEQNESETVTFKTGIEAAGARPGDVIKIADPVRAGVRRGGRIASSTTTAVTVDDDLTGVDLNGSEFFALLPNGTVESKSVVSVSGKIANLASPFSTAPASGAIWVLSTSSLEAQTFRVLQITEDENGFYEITAVAHDPDKYDAVENNLILEPRKISELSIIPDAPVGVLITESLYLSNVDVNVKVTISWQNSSTSASYIAQYRVDGGNWITIPETSSNDVDILNAASGFYEVSVVSVSAVGKRSTPSSSSKEVFGKLSVPSDVTGFSLIPVNGMASLSWDKATDLDVLVGGTVRIRWAPAITGQRWIDALDIIPAVAGSATQAQAPLLSGTYMAKFYDSSGFQSDDEVLIVTTVPAALATNVVDTITESPTFAGSKTGCEVISGALTLTSSTTWDDMIGTLDEQSSMDALGGFASTGEYLFATDLDLGAVYSSRVTASISLTAYSVDDFIDARDTLFDDWGTFDGAVVDDVFVDLYMRTTEDDPASSPIWTVWKPFVVGEYMARSFQFKVAMETDDPSHNVLISALSMTIDMPDRTVNIGNQTSSTMGTLTITYPEPFKAVPSVAITAFDAISGDYWTITNSLATGFDIVFKTSSNTIVARHFDVLAKGYGRLVT